ncbi:hypothetical protein chiPu_0015021 [Chiloscyllium punctatum]|uniref:Core shell protein Gag P30 domain-containing protein n=1 Tax=Chiloscyllium punctatum TaxID=137246 RepID=A0A401T1P3_CHIPU|nr:hypothetical protein [Chiloscyllium punctatum]
MSILGTIFSGEERGTIRRVALREWEKRHLVGEGVIPAENKFPGVDPCWQGMDEHDRGEMRDFREMVILGIREAAPKSQNFFKAFEVRQEKEEALSAFLQRLKEATRKYSGMNPDDPVAQGLLKVQFVTKSWPDIQKKLQKLEGWSEKQMEDLFCEAQKVYVKREDEKQKQKAKIMIAAVEEITMRKLESENNRGEQERQRTDGGEESNWQDVITAEKQDILKGNVQS